MIPRTCISLGLRAIPSSAGLAKPVQKFAGRQAHRAQRQKRVIYFLKPEKDEDLEKEIKNWKTE